MNSQFKASIVGLLKAVVAVLLIASCQRSPNDVWNDSQSAGRHVSRGVKTFLGDHGESRQIANNDDFQYSANAHADEFIALEDGQEMRVGDGQALQPRETPGEAGSSIPGIDAFKNPSTDPRLAGIFQNVHFEYNSSLIKGDENLEILQKIADHMKSHPNTYIFVEGHCDSRGPAAYNFALGANRANSVRNMLIQEGVDHDKIFTVSCGKEKPLVEGEGEEIWRTNRRGQFKVYEKS